MKNCFVFNPSEWRPDYEELNNSEHKLSDRTLQNCADKAAIYFTPKKQRLVRSERTRRIIFHVLVAHIVKLHLNNLDGNGDLAGPISSITQGSISISTASSDNGNKETEYFNRTIYGREYLSLIRPYLTAFLLPPIPNPIYRTFP